MSDPSPSDAPPLSVEDGLARVLETVRGAQLPTLLEQGRCDRVAVDEAIGRVLAGPDKSDDGRDDSRDAPVRARWALPSAPLSIMDGYAVRSADLILARDEHDAEALALELVDESAAGHPSASPLEPGSCARVATGAVVPEGADAVVPQEDTARIELPAPEGKADAPPRVLVEFSSVALAQVRPGGWVRAVGSDVPEGEALLPAGTLVGPGEASLLAGTGHARLRVVARPRVAVLSSGDELVPIGETPGRGQIVSTNAMMLAAQIREAGGEPVDCPGPRRARDHAPRPAGRPRRARRGPARGQRRHLRGRPRPGPARPRGAGLRARLSPPPPPPGAAHDLRPAAP
ncbi:molybdopterin biosynthesis enzyme, MoeA [Plesiocystis pacifica SIR-1]|uniref:Molybdopterin molybdenumtransferase n=1 Tax=Plesiocystis pacifica SIR-1 TaxID=391625 RepID=A6GFE0_9BACT|nr:molybdopterin biosynthesis enzyme, MoeA [Plesiocystis pacifica SIR-1]